MPTSRAPSSEPVPSAAPAIRPAPALAPPASNPPSVRPVPPPQPAGAVPPKPVAPTPSPASSTPPRAELPAATSGPPSATPPNVPEPEEPFSSARAWNRALAALGKLDRVLVTDHAVFTSFEGGVLRVGVRKEIWRDRVYEFLAHLDLVSFFPGFRRLEVTVDSAGQTVREKWSARAEAERDEARREAERTPALRRLMDLFSAELESVEPMVADGRDSSELHEELADE